MHNLVISNVPGPPVPLYFMGARIDALYPLGPVFHGAGLNITVMSNNGEVHVGIIACRESMPDVDDLVQRFPEELAKLRAAVDARSKATPIRKKRTAARSSGRWRGTPRAARNSVAEAVPGYQRIAHLTARSRGGGR